MKCTECGNVVKPVVAVDADGTMGMYHEHLLYFFDSYFGRSMPRGWNGAGDWEAYLGLTRQEYQDAKLAFRQGGFKRWMPTFYGASNLTHGLHDAGAEVWVTTTRPYLRLDSVDPDTREWLRRNKIYYDHLLYDENKYERLAEIVGKERVVGVVEDLPVQFGRAEMVFGMSVPILVERQHNLLFRSTVKMKMVMSADLEFIGGLLLERIKKWQLTS